MQQQAITENGGITVPSELELRILDSDISDLDISRCVDAHNSEWIRFFELNPTIMEQRLGSGELFLGINKRERLIGYLETQSHYVEIPDMPVDLDEPDINAALRIARFAAEQIRGSYFKHAPDGKFPDRHVNTNLIRLMSINVIPQEREYGYGGHIIEYFKRLSRLPTQERPVQLRNIVVSLTDTPTKRLPQRFHVKYQALDTHHLEPNFRPEYDYPDVNRFCYSSPGFIAPLGTR